MTDVAMWCWRPRQGTNFGDELGVRLVERLGYTVRRVPVADAELVASGSILHHPIGARTAIWGSGLMVPRKVGPFTNILALRGRLTATHLGHDDVPLGDPGLLVGPLWDRPPVRYRLGVVRHYVDTSTYPWADTVIDATRPVEEVIAAIGACATIASSSLHGLIVATSFGVPAMRIPHPKVRGGDYKWLDTLSALNRPLPEVQESLIKALKALG